MKKTYIAPEMEIKKFSVEDIMTSSSLPTKMDPLYKEEAGKEVHSVNYSDIFGI